MNLQIDDMQAYLESYMNKYKNSPNIPINQIHIVEKALWDFINYVVLNETILGKDINKK